VSASGSGWSCTHSGNVSVTCTRASLASGTSAPVITVVVTAPATSGAMANTAQVLASTVDPAPSNNTSTAPTSVLPTGGGGGGGGGSQGPPLPHTGTTGPPLPHTGADGFARVSVGLALVALGVALVTVSRRRADEGPGSGG
jgi:hypothetical protein